MPLYTCRFCDYINKLKPNYYNHLNKHIDEHADSIEPEELELCKFYRNKTSEYIKKYRENNKEQISQRNKEYRENNKEQLYQRKKKYCENNKEKISQRMKEYLKEYRQNNKEFLSQQRKEYYIRKKLEKQRVEDIDELIIDCD
jgi:hypothetical protein